MKKKHAKITFIPYDDDDVCGKAFGMIDIAGTGKKHWGTVDAPFTGKEVAAIIIDESIAFHFVIPLNANVDLIIVFHGPDRPATYLFKPKDKP